MGGDVGRALFSSGLRWGRDERKGEEVLLKTTVVGGGGKPYCSIDYTHFCRFVIAEQQF